MPENTMGRTYSYWAVHPFRRPDPKPWPPGMEEDGPTEQRKSYWLETGETLIFSILCNCGGQGWRGEMIAWPIQSSTPYGRGRWTVRPL